MSRTANYFFSPLPLTGAFAGGKFSGVEDDAMRHPDNDAPEFHPSRCGPDGSAPKSRRHSREELRRLQEQLDEIARAQRATGR